MSFISNTNKNYMLNTDVRLLIKLFCICVLSCLLLTTTACSQANKSKSSSSNQISPPLENATADDTQDQTLETLKVLSAPKGLNTKRLFASQLDNPDLRDARLEQEVQRLRDDFDLVSPSITRLVAVEQDMRDLMAQLETLVQAEGTQAPADNYVQDSPKADQMPMSLQAQNNAQQSVMQQAKSEAAQQADANSAPQLPPARMDSTVNSVRFGEHSDKTRIVMDVTNTTEYSAVLKDAGTRLEVMLPRSAWMAQRSWSSGTSPLVNSYSVVPLVEGGHKVVFNFNGTANIKAKGIYPPVSNKMYRIVIDVSNPNIHVQ